MLCLCCVAMSLWLAVHIEGHKLFSDSLSPPLSPLRCLTLTRWLSCDHRASSLARQRRTWLSCATTAGKSSPWQHCVAVCRPPSFRFTALVQPASYFYVNTLWSQDKILKVDNENKRASTEPFLLWPKYGLNVMCCIVEIFILRIRDGPYHVVTDIQYCKNSILW